MIKVDSSNDSKRAEEKENKFDSLAISALTQYDLPKDAQVTLINISENITYRVESPTTGKKWALRIHRENYHDYDTIASELEWIKSLKEDGTTDTPVPVMGTDGKFIQLISYKTFNPRYVVLFVWEEGEAPDEIQLDTLHHSFEILGKTSARMHLHALSWNRPNLFKRPTWDFDMMLGKRQVWGDWRDGLGMTSEIAKILSRATDLIQKRLKLFGQDVERFNLVHCDMRPANLLIDNSSAQEKVKVIDFDDCGFSWFMYDCATTVSFFEHKPEVPELLAAWIQGYRKITELSDADEREIATFVLLRRILLVAWVRSHSETELAKTLGTDYTESTVPMCEDYLSQF